MQLLIGAGSNHTKKLHFGNEAWDDLTTLDINEAHNPDVVHDLEDLDYPFKNNSFDEIHAYEVLEHIGSQGDYEFFFAQFSELWRILKPEGKLIGTCPSRKSVWAWGDPSHKRIIQPEQFIFLDQTEYKQVGITAMSDFRYLYQADFRRLHLTDDGEVFQFVLEAVKPSRINNG